MSLRDERRCGFMAEIVSPRQPHDRQLTDRLIDGMGGDVFGAAATGLLTAPALLVPLLSAAMQSTAKASDEQRRIGGSELQLQKQRAKEKQRPVSSRPRSCHRTRAAQAHRSDPHGPSELLDVVDSRRLVCAAHGLVQVDDEQIALLALQLLAAGGKRAETADKGRS